MKPEDLPAHECGQNDRDALCLTLQKALMPDGSQVEGATFEATELNRFDELNFIEALRAEIKCLICSFGLWLKSKYQTGSVFSDQMDKCTGNCELHYVLQT